MPVFVECIGRTFRYGMPAALFIILPGACAVQMWLWLTGHIATGESAAELIIFVVVTTVWMIAIWRFGWHSRLYEHWSRIFA